MIFLLSLTTALAVFFLVIVVVIYVKNTLSINIFYRMRRHKVKPIMKKENSSEEWLMRLYEFIKKISKPLVERNFAQFLEKNLSRAGIPLYGGEYVVINLLLVALVGFLTLMLTMKAVYAVIGMAMVPLALWMIILTLKGRRLEAFTEQLSDCLITISNALRAGYSFQQTIEIISKEMEPPIGEEFSRMNHDVIMGVPLEEALESANTRIGSSDFELVMTAVLIQREVGGNLAQVLDNISYTIAERIRMRREILAITAQGRLSSIVLVLLPFAAGTAMFFFNHDNFVQMLEDPMGQMAMVVAVVCEILGYIIIRRIVNIEV
ncbi:MAG: type II secretion system F family protein [Selenomonadaceae bacterium]|nr:type II secretion system F family protein [Selenomonadaceae bacterium]